MPCVLTMLNAMAGPKDYHSCTFTMSVRSVDSEAELFSWNLQSAFQFSSVQSLSCVQLFATP